MYVDFKEETAMQSGFSGGLLWMLSGIMMGLLVGLTMYYFANRGIPIIEEANASPQEVSTSQNTTKTSSFAKDKEVVTSPFGASNNANDPENRLVESLIDKNHKEESKQRPSFSYYAVLPDLNVPIQTIHNPVEKKAKPTKTINDATTVKKANLVAGESAYLLQVASYRKRSLADRSKSRLERKGMTAYVEERKVNSRTWFRVMVGPVGAKELVHWKANVMALGHKPLTYPVKN
jgi:cell division protein FtsN